MKKLITTLAATLLFTLVSTQVGHAQSGPFTTVGTWTFFIKINGAPPCQCIQIANLRADGSIDAPANDRFGGAGLGKWNQVGNGDVRFVILQNSINEDGTAGGLYVIRGSMTLNAAGDTGSGTTTFQILDSAGKVTFNGTATFTGVKLKLD